MSGYGSLGLRLLRILPAAWDQLVLAVRLLFDRRVPITAKAVLPLVAAYVISPIDVLPDIIPGLGQLDDVGVILLGLGLFFKLCPPQVLAEHRQRSQGSASGADPSAVFEGKYRIVKD